ncbi:MAG: 4-hydroxy-tetrahydrodipicolinate synthase [Defluviitaleaceae bacterium]|nr:4-hydroxy-tetrahydrodipicolinate synthase [Defluviitaleaceae bacterium]MCL2240021.1 4-hydroxy-tetrahydrodipicolinate synthase [Defluviitaleaceae bacterium]MCL2240686.1 4-hydroxy-tetrahydrodipicolinate synthase [Defluviitaleaceae bacterium]
MAIFTGSGAAICTPFDKSGGFSPGAYEKLIQFQVEEGTDAIVACGTTGEMSTLSTQEHIEVVRVAVAAAKKYGDAHGRKVPVVAGAGGNDTAKCEAVGKALVQAGVDALMYVTPYYNKTSQRGLVAHYTRIAKAVEVPIVMYNIPGRTGMNMTPTTMAELAKLPNIAAVKEATGDFGQVAEIAERCGDALDIYSGNDDYIVPILSLGGKGVISTIANIAPRQVHDMVAKFHAGDIAGSREIQLGMLPVVRCLFADVNPIVVKAALNLMDFDMGLCRAPLTTPEDALVEALREAMTAYGLLK